MRQRQALAVMLAGESVFLTGPPGAGKTYVLNEFIRRAARQNKHVAVTASTGIAATHIGGTTIHSWSGLGVRESLSEWDMDRLEATERLVKRYNATDTLVIDEISMLHGRLLDMLDEVCRVLRRSDAPFGGLQVVLVGDLFQLPPVSRGSDVLDFVHLSNAWHELNPKICYITEQHRQQQDGLLDLLDSMRRGDVNEDHEAMLGERLEAYPGEQETVTRLFAHNADVEAINQRHLEALDSEAKTYAMQTKGATGKVEQLTRSLLAPEQLTLKRGAEVMFVANNFPQGFVNGSRGRVVDFADGMPVIELINGRTIRVEPHSWTIQEDGKKRAEAVQLPLRLAWAITIHKSQGMSLDAAEIDLSRSFTPGMGYVALSRVRSLDGVYLRGINRMALSMHPEIFEFDNRLREDSDRLAEVIEDAAEELKDEREESGELSKPNYDEALFNKLKRWRFARAQSDKVAPFIIAHNTALETLAARPPATKQALLALPGFGKMKVDKYGDDILAITASYAAGNDEPAPVIDVVKPVAKQASAQVMGWNEADDQRLLELFRSGTPLTESAKLLNRSPDDLWTRLTDLRKS